MKTEVRVEQRSGRSRIRKEEAGAGVWEEVKTERAVITAEGFPLEAVN